MEVSDGVVRIRIGEQEQQLTLDEFERRVRAGQLPPDVLVQFDAVTGDEFVRAGDLEIFRSLHNEGAVAWRARFRRGPPPILTAILCGVMLRVHFQPLMSNWLTEPFLLWAPLVLENAQPWRLLTMSLLHANLVHIAGNLLFFVYTAANIERALGRLNLATIYVAAVLTGSLFSMAGSPETRSIGASGGIFGLIAFSVTFGLLRQELLPERGRRLFGFALLPYLVVMMGMGLFDDMTDNWCHFGGLVAGAVMGLLLDPEPLQRRPRWNLRLRSAVWVAGAALLAVLAGFGPRLVPLVSSTEARHHSMGLRGLAPPDTYQALQWWVPAGWAQVPNAVGKLGFASPSGPHHFAVWEEKHARATDTADLFSVWESRVLELHPDALVLGPEPASIAGRPGLGAHARVPEDPPLELTWRGTTQGLWTVQLTWQVEASRSARLGPLRDRLLRSVVWGEPASLMDAKLAVEWKPESQKARLDLARALSEAGQPDQALPLLEQGIAAAPDDPTPLYELLALLALYPDVVDADPWLTRALQAHPHPRTVTRVVLVLEALDRKAEAWGLLDIAWYRNPGDRTLRSALRKRGIGRRLTEDAVPWNRTYDPVTGAPIEPGRPEALTLQAAKARGVTLVQQQRALRAHLIEQLASDDPGAVRTAWMLKSGHPPESPSDALEALARDLASEEPPDWLPVGADLLRLREWVAAATPEQLQ